MLGSSPGHPTTIAASRANRPDLCAWASAEAPTRPDRRLAFGGERTFDGRAGVDSRAQ